MGFDSNNTTDEDTAEKGGEQNFDFWSDEGARRFNEIMDEGSTYNSADVRLAEDIEVNLEDEPCENLDQELYDTDEETLPPGEMELIFENCFIM